MPCKDLSDSEISRIMRKEAGLPETADLPWELIKDGVTVAAFHDKAMAENVRAMLLMTNIKTKLMKCAC